MRKAPNPKFFIFLTAITLVGGIGFSIFEYSGLQDTEMRVAKLDRDSLNQNELEDKLKSSLTKLQQCSASLNHLESGVPELDYVPTMLKELEDVGTQSGLLVLGVRPIPKAESQSKVTSKKVVRKQYTELDIEVTCRGTYHAVKSFVQALQSFPKIVEARTISLTPKVDPKAQGAPKLDATISLRSYLFPPDKGSLKPAQDVVNENQEAVN